MKIMFKYNIESRGREGNSNTWTIYKEIDKGMDDFIFTDHIEFEVPISTEEKQNGMGFGMTCEGNIVHDINDLDGSAYIRIVKDS